MPAKPCPVPQISTWRTALRTCADTMGEPRSLRGHQYADVGRDVGGGNVISRVGEIPLPGGVVL